MRVDRLSLLYPWKIKINVQCIRRHSSCLAENAGCLYCKDWLVDVVWAITDFCKVCAGHTVSRICELNTGCADVRAGRSCSEH